MFDRVARRLARPVPSLTRGDHDLNPDLAPAHGGASLRPAAVLVGIVDAAPVATFILTRRTAGLAAHPGQIAFPGGGRDADDRDAVACALREAREEIGLDPALVEPLGLLPDYITGSGFRVTPVVARIDRHHDLRPNPAEVAEVFEVPLPFLMDLGNHRLAHRVIAGAERHFVEIAFRHYLIWGATAGIIRSFHETVWGP